MSVRPNSAPLDEHLEALSTGRLYRFSDKPNVHVPDAAFGAYSVWLRDGRLLYVGIGGPAMMVGPKDSKPRGLLRRLNSHQSGSRAYGNRFCISVCDRLVIPTLSPD
jgi:hypothetical protein